VALSLGHISRTKLLRLGFAVSVRKLGGLGRRRHEAAATALRRDETSEFQLAIRLRHRVWVDVELLVECIMFRSWTEQLMPDAVKISLGGTAPATGG